MENALTHHTNAITTSAHVSTGVVPKAGGDRGVAGGALPAPGAGIGTGQPTELSRLEKQASMMLEQMLEELPKTLFETKEKRVIHEGPRRTTKDHQEKLKEICPYSCSFVSICGSS